MSFSDWLSERERLEKAATQKAWTYYKTSGVHRVSTCEPGHETFQERICDLTSPAFRGEQTEDDGRFIADARNHAAKMHAMLRVMRGALEVVRECEPNYGGRQTAEGALAEVERIAAASETSVAGGITTDPDLSAGAPGAGGSGGMDSSGVFTVPNDGRIYTLEGKPAGGDE